MSTFRNLQVYQKAFELATSIFEVSKQFPKEERYSLTDQIRRSSRSVCACIGEAYRKRRYPKHFTSKTSDANMENSETSVWLDFAKQCSYIDEEQYQKWLSLSDEIGRMLTTMENHPERFV